MNFAEISRKLRRTSSAYGGIVCVLEAADGLDRALDAFWKEQTPVTLRDLNGAFVKAWKEFEHLESRYGQVTTVGPSEGA